MTEYEILKGMRTLLADPDRWGRGLLEDQLGRCCMLGAAGKIANYDVRAYIMPTLQAVVRRRGYPSIANYNDETDHARVLSAIDEAIAILEAKQPSTCAAVKKLIDDAVRSAEVAGA
jgi:hypothetical protein